MQIVWKRLRSEVPQKTRDTMRALGRIFRLKRFLNIRGLLNINPKSAEFRYFSARFSILDYRSSLV